MAYPKLTEESYSNLAGMNIKISPYQTDITQCLNLINFDFSQMGSWTKRPGTAVWNGVSLGNGAFIHSAYEFERLSGFSTFVLGYGSTMFLGADGLGATPVLGSSDLSKSWDFQTFVDHLFVATGPTAFTSNGSTTWCYGPPPPKRIVTRPLAGASLLGTGGGSLFSGPTFLTDPMYVTVDLVYLNARGVFGPRAVSSHAQPSLGPQIVQLNPGATSGAITNSIHWGGTTQFPGHGVSAAALLLSDLDSVGATYMPFLYFMRTGLGTTLHFDGITSIDTTLQPLIRDPSFNLAWTLCPQYFETVNNQMFMAGFTVGPSIVRWSDIGEPEYVDPTWFNEVRTDDGDIIRGLKAFQEDGVIFKERSFHRFRANSPEDVTFFQVSNEFGCLCNQAVAIHATSMYFLDHKGIVEYDGIRAQLISQPVETVFQRMNVSAAKTTARAINNTQRNEIWFAIPVDGATLNNVITVYDYFARAWTTWNGPNFTSLAYAKGGTSTIRSFSGDQNGAFNAWGTSLTSDNGVGITCLVQTRWHYGSGESIEKLYRQFFLNTSVGDGSTQAINVRIFKNYGASPGAVGVISQGAFQSRIDFGISCKSISAEISHFSATSLIQIPGYTFKHRFLRNL